MSDSQNVGFGQFVPGFDFLQNLAKGASQTVPPISNLSHWIAPTLDLEELEKRITELKAVHFWLEQNSKALGATVQALEVQKMTLATLKGMNFNIGDMANAPKFKAVKSAPVAAVSEPVDPMQLWGALSQQFQQIAAGVMKDVGNKNDPTPSQSAIRKKPRKTSPTSR